MISKIVFWLLAVALAIGVAVWIFWPMLHKDIGKDTVKATNEIVVQQKAAVNAAVERKDSDAGNKIAKVVRRSATDAGVVRSSNSAAPGAYSSWIAGLCANDIYEGYADCARYRSGSTNAVAGKGR